MTASNPQSTSSAAVDGYTSGPNTPDLTTPVASTNAPSALSQIGTTYSAISGLTSGTTTGQIGGALSAGKLVNNNLNGANPQVGGALGAAGGVLGVYNGLQQGGVAGYGGAAVGALHAGAGVATMAGDTSLAGSLGNAAGALAIPLALYNFANNWQSGNTTSDAISGAETGATIGSAFGPEGTLIGAVGGAAIGAASSAFGPGKTDPEEGTYASYLNAYTAGGTQAENAEETKAGVASTIAVENNPKALTGMNSYTSSPQYAAALAKQSANQGAANAAYASGGDQAVAGATGTQNFQALAGLFDARSSSLPIYQQYGRQGEGAFMTDMTTQINNAVKSGAISASATPQQIYSSVVEPWIGKMGTPSTGYQDPNANAPVQELLTNLIGDYQQGQTMDTIGGTAANFGTYA
jgi:hypothetical protein